MTLVRKALLLLVSALMTQACGSSGGIISEFIGVNVKANAVLSGTVASDGFVGRGTDLAIGDNNSNGNASGFYAFVNPSIPSTATVRQATLTTYQFNVTGTPYTDLGPDINTYMVDLGPTLDAPDLAAYAAGTYIGVISATPALGMRTLDVTAAVSNAISMNAARFDFQLRFVMTSDNNNDDDFVNFVDPGNIAATPIEPTLSIEWKP